MAARRQYSRSYVMPYRKVGQLSGEFEVFVPEKLVVCCEAVGQLRGKIETGTHRHQWSKVNWDNPLNSDGRLLDRNGRQLDIGARLGGTLLSGGGRPYVPGGKVRGEEGKVQAALRELKKETTLDFGNPHLLTKIHETNWDGVYYGFEITANVDQAISASNKSLVQHFQQQNSLEFLEKVYDHTAAGKFVAVKSLKWVPLEMIEREMAAKPPEDFLRNEVERCALLMFKVLGISKSQPIQPLQDGLFDVMYNHQKIEDNVAAAGKLAVMLRGYDK